MKKILLFITLLTTCSFSVLSQTCQWAISAVLPSRSKSVTVKEDLSGNFYFAATTDSVSTRISTTLQKRDQNQQLQWQKIIYGNAGISDVEINTLNHAIVTGYFTGTIEIDGTIFSSIYTTGFIYETDESGTMTWVHTINPINASFSPHNLYISPDGRMYLTSQVSGSAGVCAFHELDVWGNIIRNEFNNNFENRTFTNILSDSAGNIYLSGTCGNGATFDTISANPSFSYQNFIVMYDSTFTAKWFLSKNYITFDDNNKLTTDGNALYWVCEEFKNNQDTIRIVKCNFNGQVISDIEGPLSPAFFPGIDFSMNKSGTSILVISAFQRFYMYQYDNSLNVTWMDTLYVRISGFPLSTGLICYDSSFYLGAQFFGDTLHIDSFEVYNSNGIANYPSDIFVAKWSLPAVSGIGAYYDDKSFSFYPNPAVDMLYVVPDKNFLPEKIFISDMKGSLVYSGNIFRKEISISTLLLKDGLYILTLMDKNGVKEAGKLLISH